MIKNKTFEILFNQVSQVKVVFNNQSQFRGHNDINNFWGTKHE
jgi:hypothetical protein